MLSIRHRGCFCILTCVSVLSAGCALQPAESADADARDLRVAAAGAGAKRREIRRRGRAPIFGLQDGEAGGLRERTRWDTENTKDTKKTKDTTIRSETNYMEGPTESRQPIADSLCSHDRRCRVAAEYSNIWAARSHG